MKKFLTLLILGSLFSCSTSEDSEIQFADEIKTDEMERKNVNSKFNLERVYFYDEKKYTLEFTVNGSEVKPVKDQKHYDLFFELLQNSNTVVYPVNLGQYNMVFENKDDLQYYLANPSKMQVAPMDELPLPPGSGGGGGVPTPNDPNGNISLFEHDNFSGKEIKTSSSIQDLGRYGYGHRITGIKINDEVSKVILYEEPYYQGHRIEITGAMDIPCLCDLRINRSSVIYLPVNNDHPWDSDDWCGGGFTFGCNSWNDEVSSIKIIYD